jgi:hypothetical protein
MGRLKQKVSLGEFFEFFSNWNYSSKCGKGWITTRQDKVRQDKVRQDKTRQPLDNNKTRPQQDKITRQENNKTRQPPDKDKTRHDGDKTKTRQDEDRTKTRQRQGQSSGKLRFHVHQSLSVRFRRQYTICDIADQSEKRKKSTLTQIRTLTTQS